MDWIEFINVAVGIVGTIIGIIGGSVGIIYWKQNKALKQAEADKSKAEANISTTEARLAEANYSERILEKFQKIVLERMDSGEAVRQQELTELSKRIDKRFDTMEQENVKQNSLLADIVEYLNGDFNQFEEKKKRRKTKPKEQ